MPEPRTGYARVEIVEGGGGALLIRVNGMDLSGCVLLDGFSIERERTRDGSDPLGGWVVSLKIASDDLTVEADSNVA